MNVYIVGISGEAIKEKNVVVLNEKEAWAQPDRSWVFEKPDIRVINYDKEQTEEMNIMANDDETKLSLDGEKVTWAQAEVLGSKFVVFI